MGVTSTHVSRYMAYSFEPIEPIDVLLSVLSVHVIGVNKIPTLVTNQHKYPRCCIYFVTWDEVAEEFRNSITDLVRRLRWTDREAMWRLEDVDMDG